MYLAKSYICSQVKATSKQIITDINRNKHISVVLNCSTDEVESDHFHFPSVEIRHRNKWSELIRFVQQTSVCQEHCQSPSCFKGPLELHPYSNSEGKNIAQKLKLWNYVLKQNSVFTWNTQKRSCSNNIMLLSGCVSSECYRNETGKYTEDIQKQYRHFSLE